MKRLTIFMLSMIGALLATAQCVYFSEYLEGSGNNKCLEIYNGTGQSIDLSSLGYTIYIYANGSNSHTSTIALNGVLASGEVYIVCNPNADSTLLVQADQTSGNVNFNGDDAVELVNGNGILDIIGQIGTDPGLEWAGTICTQGTANGTMIRRASLACPSFDGLSSFNPDTEWDCFPSNTSSDLGSHTMTACVITDLSAEIDSCSNGMTSISLNFYANNAPSNAFQLTISPDPGGYSGVYPYATSLPLIMNGFVADSITTYSFSVSDTLDGTCSTQLNNQVFDCPVADQLSFTSVPLGCVGDNNLFMLQVCAVEGSSGKTQTDYHETINLSLDGGATGTVTGSTSVQATKGCATFTLSYDISESISFTATDGTLMNANSGTIQVSANCASLTLHKAVLNPCGADSQNEYFGGNTGNSPVSIGDLLVANINPNSGVQPNTNFTWSASGNETGGNPNETCGVIGLQCNRFLDINNAIDSALITALIDSLNAQANCSSPLFVAPTGADLGIIPAYSKVVFFLGGGGNTSGTIAPGFDDIGANLDFSIFCGEGPIYAIFGNHKNASTTFGFFSNSAPRTYYISVNGNISTSLTYTSPTGSGESETIREDGFYMHGEDCTPLDLFADQVLGAELLWFDGKLEKGKGIVLEWEMFQDFQNYDIWIEKRVEGFNFQSIGKVKSTTKRSEIQKYNFTDSRPSPDINSYRLKFLDLEGDETYSQIIDIENFVNNNLKLVQASPNPAEDVFNLSFFAKESQDVRFQLNSIIGKSVMVRNLVLSKGRNDFQLDVSNLTNGLYLYTVQSRESVLHGRLIIK